MSGAKNTLIWAAALGVSLAAHAAIAGFVLINVKPDPLDEQPQLSGKVRMQSQEVERQKAAPQPADAPAAEQGNSRGNPAQQGEVSQSRAGAQPLPTDTVTAAPPPGDTVAATQSPSDRLETAAPPADALSPARVQPELMQPAAAPRDAVAAAEPAGAQTPALTAQGPVVSAAPPPTIVQSASAPPAMATTAAAPPPTQAVTPAATTAQTVIAGAPRLAPTAASVIVAPQSGTVAPPATDAPSAPPPSSAAANPPPPSAPAPVAVPETTLISAETGWAGASDAPFDPVSLAAVQSFMRPLDTSAEAGSPRDAMGDFLAGVPCSRLSATFVPETGTLELRGHLPDAAMANPIVAQLQARLGDSIPVEGNVIVLPSPQCNMLEEVENLGLPQSRKQRQDPMQVGAATQLATVDYGAGERVIVRMNAYDFPSYVYVDFFDAEGNVLHLRPNPWESLVMYQPGDVIAVGDDRPGESSVQLIVQPPFGLELVVAYASSVPLYDGLREPVEPAAAYLDWLRARIATVRAETPDYKGDWVYMFVQTHQ